MTPDDAPAPTRRARRAQTGDVAVVRPAGRAEGGILTIESAALPPGSGSSTAPGVVDAQASTVAALPFTTIATDTGMPAASGDGSGPVALAWVDETTIGRSSAPGDLSAAATPYVQVGADLLADAPRRSPLRAGVIVPTLVIAGVVGAYSATTLLWPLHAVAPTVAAVEVQPASAPPTTPAWPAQGSAAIAVGGITGSAASAPEADAIASITKVVTALVVLDEMPLAVGEQGPEFRFTAADRTRYWQYRSNDESALDVPVGGSLTQYQMLEGLLIGSANNYADRLAQNLWPTDAVFASAANAWLANHGVPGVTVVEPSGIDEGNTASPEALVALAQKALANPVIAEIVAKQSVELPGAGLVENSNGLLADPGVVGIKTGTLAAWNLLSAKDITVGDTTVRLFASVLGQPDNEARLAASRALYTQLEQELQLKPSVTAGTIAGRVETMWGEPVDIVTAGDASVVLWNGGTGTVGTTYDLGEQRDEGDAVGALTVSGPLDEASVELQLADDVDGPSPWWRLTHPLDLFGLNG
ncbi:D-alanyl-D-alanine carboxypeptidase [Microbacterium sp. HD4P20]|uniref:D-alanyl-D-alanine carboxypeptidase n=1 Tax=Microbacterium sp. HD4P20 TaxID=2864874 RepID=UPI001C63ED0E|nr:D-alanyl-D-alanine carboxypeptidase [Microbacterium sp. HD4P20]MCP2635771.1 D-alanyl-D-alanine carboxypeptidase [Microbacterium sp. HD4P20]